MAQKPPSSREQARCDDVRHAVLETEALDDRLDPAQVPVTHGREEVVLDLQVEPLRDPELQARARREVTRRPGLVPVPVALAPGAAAVLTARP